MREGRWRGRISHIADRLSPIRSGHLRYAIRDMRRRAARRLPALLSAALLTLAACSGVQTSSYKLIGAPDLPPTDPASVQILAHRPLRPFVRLGQVRAEPEGEADNTAIEQALQKEAAKMGADAIIVLRQGERPIGFEISGFPGSAEARREMGRVVVGEAIHFRRE